MLLKSKKNTPQKKLWQKSYSVLPQVEAFTVGRDREMDLFLAPYDVLGSLAHIRMLASIGLLTKEEWEILNKSLQDIYGRILKGNFDIEPGVEDVHSQVELLLTREVGEAGKKIHSGRSRNDQVLVDLRLFFRAEITSLVQEVTRLFDLLLHLSEQHKNFLLPGYTHLQVAMVSSYGLWLGAYAESLVDDVRLLQAVYDIVNQNPLGSAAGYGSSFPLNRRMTTELLGFADLNYNVVHAQMGRGKSEHYLAFGLAGLAHTVGKLAMDICLYMNQNFGFVSFPDEWTTGSSIMPHKKNPDVFELIRGRCNTLQALPGMVSQLTGNLPSGYHRDFQLLKEHLFPAIQSMKDCLRIATAALKEMRINPDALAGDRYQYLYTVEAVNEAVLQGLPFREAYRQVGEAVEKGTFRYSGELKHTHEGSLGNLCLPEVQEKMNRVLAGFGFEKADQAVRKLLL